MDVKCRIHLDGRFVSTIAEINTKSMTKGNLLHANVSRTNAFKDLNNIINCTYLWNTINKTNLT